MSEKENPYLQSPGGAGIALAHTALHVGQRHMQIIKFFRVK